MQQFAKLAFLVWVLAWAMTNTSQYMWANLPIAVALVAVGTWIFLHVDIQAKNLPGKAGRRRGLFAGMGEDAPSSGLTGHRADGNKWRERVQAPVVELAWETLCGSILQEFIYDMWWGLLTPDKDFPRDVRRVLNDAFGELAFRARKTDVKILLRDVAELVMEQIDLFRYTRASIQEGVGEQAFRQMTAAACERAMQAEMRAEKNLHPALYPPGSGHAPTGHYKFIRQICDGMTAYLMDKSDFNKIMMRAAARELLAACVIRPIMYYFTPYNINKMVLALLQERVQKRTLREAMDVEEAVAAAASIADKPGTMKGHWEFAQRVLQSQQSEDKSAAPAKGAKHRDKQRSHRAEVGKSSEAPAKPQKQHKRAASMQSLPETVAGPMGLEDAIGSRINAHGDLEGATPHPELTPTCHSSALQTPSEPQAAQAELPQQQVLQEKQGGPGALQQPADGERGGQPAEGREPPQQKAAPPLSQGSAHLEQLRNMYGLAQGEGPGSRPSILRAPQSQANMPPSPFMAEGVGPAADHSAGDAAGRLRERRLSTGSSCQTSPEIARTHQFRGRPRAVVVAADLNSEGSKDYVVYKLRVADLGDGTEWTVSRRFRNFESLHRQLREVSAYRLKLPPKRIFLHMQTPEFVEERRQQLDQYLQALLGAGNLGNMPQVMEFLSPDSDLYDTEDEPGFLKSLGAQMLNANLNMKRAMGDMVEEMDQKRRKGLAVIAGRRFLDDSEPQRTQSGLEGRSRSYRDLQRVDSSPPRAPLGPPVHPLPPQAMPRRQQPQKEGSSHQVVISGQQVLGAATSIISKAANVGSRAVSNVKSNVKSTLHTRDDSGAGTDPLRAERSWDHPDSPRSGAASRASSMTAAGDSHSSEASRPTLQKAESARAPSRFRPDGLEDGPMVRAGRRSEDAVTRPLGTGTRSAKQLHVTPKVTLGAQTAGNLMSATATLLGRGDDFEAASGAGLDWEDNIGISAPLYDIVDEIFGLQSRGFVRRQVFGVARQVLSLVAGSAIDEYLLSQLRLLRQEHTLARLIHGLQNMLWPGGTWFQSAPNYPGKAPPRDPNVPPPRPALVTAEQFLQQPDALPLDHEEINEAVYELLLSKGPPVLVRLIGRNCYQVGMSDVFQMMQSQTFVQQIGYGLLKICVVNLFPELKPLFKQTEMTAQTEAPAAPSH